MAISEMRDRRAADWLKCRDEREDKKFHWTTGEVATYRGFFELGFEAGMAYREEIEARALEQATEMREAAIAFVKGAKWWEYHATKGTMWQSDQALVADEAAKRYGYRPTSDDMIRALLARESAEPAEPPSVDDLLLQEIFSLREKLKIAVEAIAAKDPSFDRVEFLHQLGSVDLDQLMEELNESAELAEERTCGMEDPAAEDAGGCATTYDKTTCSECPFKPAEEPGSCNGCGLFHAETRPCAECKRAFPFVASLADHYKPAEEPCSACDGKGWTAEHCTDANAHDDEGKCNPGFCPVQVECETCNGTGRKPAEERGPEVGDLVAEYHSGVTSEGCEFWMFRRWKKSDEVPGMYTEAERRYHRFTVLMRAAEVEARIGGKSSEMPKGSEARS